MVFVHEVHIYETYNGGALVKIEAMVPSGRFVELWSVQHPQHITQARVFKPALQVSNQINKNDKSRLLKCKDIIFQSRLITDLLTT